MNENITTRHIHEGGIQRKGKIKKVILDSVNERDQTLKTKDNT